MFTHEFYFFFQNKSPFSNWYIRNFKVREMIFNCVEQYMMYSKAILFGDMETAKLIMAESKPKKQKALGRQVKGFNRIAWDFTVDGILYTATKAKFTQHRDLGELMLNINAKEFVEASPYDSIYGVKLSMNDSRIQTKKLWLGLNKTGRVVTRVRNWLYVQKKGKKMSNDETKPAFIVFDLAKVFAATTSQVTHMADLSMLIPTIVTNVVNCLESKDTDLARLDVYAKDVTDQFENDGMTKNDGILVANAIKAIGHAVLYEITNIEGYDANDSFDYEVIRVELSGAVYMARRDPVGAKALDEVKDENETPEFQDYVGVVAKALKEEVNWAEQTPDQICAMVGKTAKEMYDKSNMQARQESQQPTSDLPKSTVVYSKEEWSKMTHVSIEHEAHLNEVVDTEHGTLAESILNNSPQSESGDDFKISLKWPYGELKPIHLDMSLGRVDWDQLEAITKSPMGYTDSEGNWVVVQDINNKAAGFRSQTHINVDTPKEEMSPLVKKFHDLTYQLWKESKEANALNPYGTARVESATESHPQQGYFQGHHNDPDKKE